MGSAGLRCGARIAAAGLFAAAVLLAPAHLRADVLENITQSKSIRIAYRNDAPPFSYRNKIGEPAGFMVDLCRSVVKRLTLQLKQPSLKVVYVPVTAADRFDTIKQNKADLLCEPTSVTLSRREIVDFSILTFVDGASIMIRSEGPRDLKGLAGQKIGVLAGTTTEQALRNALKAVGVEAEVVLAKTHAEGLAMLEDGKVTAYFGDRFILLSLIASAKEPTKLLVADNYLTFEPYALALPRGEDNFRLAVDRALSRIYRSGEIGTIFEATFGPGVQPGTILQTLYLITSLPD